MNYFALRFQNSFKLDIWQPYCISVLSTTWIQVTCAVNFYDVITCGSLKRKIHKLTFETSKYLRPNW